MGTQDSYSHSEQTVPRPRSPRTTVSIADMHDQVAFDARCGEDLSGGCLGRRWRAGCRHHHENRAWRDARQLTLPKDREPSWGGACIVVSSTGWGRA